MTVGVSCDSGGGAGGESLRLGCFWGSLVSGSWLRSVIEYIRVLLFLFWFLLFLFVFCFGCPTIFGLGLFYWAVLLSLPASYFILGFPFRLFPVSLQLLPGFLFGLSAPLIFVRVLRSGLLFFVGGLTFFVTYLFSLLVGLSVSFDGG